LATKRIRFLCEHCGQTLSVGTSKVGSEVKCPKCKAAAEVPTEEAATAQMASRKPTDSPQEPADPFAAFAVYDEDVELIYEGHLAEPRAESEPADFDRDKVAVSRTVIYLQGALLTVATLAAFTFGVVVGGSTSAPSVEDETPNPCVVKGEITFTQEGAESTADSGALVVIIPQSDTPGEKADLTTLQAPFDDHSGVMSLREIGGDLALADEDGKCVLSLPDDGKFFVLILSAEIQREADEIPPGKDLAEMGRYFVDAAGLIGSRGYVWLDQNVDGNSKVNHDFK
jgi:phage FluMu protein Com